MKTLSANTSILGAAWLTPHGSRIPEVTQLILENKTAPLQELELPDPRGSTLPVHRIPAELLKATLRNPRLRRSGDISHFAVNAALQTLENFSEKNKSPLSKDQLARTRLIYATTDGGITYTKKFHGNILTDGPGSGSPLLFPETVHNAATSHIATACGLDSEALTFVGDSAVTFSAIRAAEELLSFNEADYCLVVASQETHPISCLASQVWGLSENSATKLSEGSAAILLGRSHHNKNNPASEIEVSILGSGHYRSRSDAKKWFQKNISHSALPPHFAVCADSPTTPLPDSAWKSLFNLTPDSGTTPLQHYFLPHQLGDAGAVTALWQIIFAGQLLKMRDNKHAGTALCATLGRNNQLGLAEVTHRKTAD